MRHVSCFGSTQIERLSLDPSPRLCQGESSKQFCNFHFLRSVNTERAILPVYRVHSLAKQDIDPALGL